MSGVRRSPPEPAPSAESPPVHCTQDQRNGCVAEANGIQQPRTFRPAGDGSNSHSKKDQRLPSILVISHVLPNSRSGQSQVLRLLLERLPTRHCTYLSVDANQESWSSLGSLAIVARRVPQPNIWLALRFLPGTIGAAVRVAVTLMHRAWHIARTIRRSGAEVVVACSGDLFDIPAAAIAARLMRRPLMLYLFDDYLYQWVGGYRRAARVLEPMSVRTACAVIAPNEFLAAAYRARYGVEPHIVRNPVEPAAMESGEVRSDEAGCDRSDPARIVYTGSVYWAHFDAFRNLADALNLAGVQAELDVYTAQPPDVLSTNGISGPVRVYPFVAPPEVYAVQRAADILFLPLAFRSNIPEVIRTSAPGKLGEFLAAGRPLLVHAPADSFVAQFVLERNCGCVVTEQDPARLAGAVRKLCEDREYARSLVDHAQAAARCFDVNESVAAFAAVLKRIAGDSRD